MWLSSSHKYTKQKEKRDRENREKRLHIHIHKQNFECGAALFTTTPAGSKKKFKELYIYIYKYSINLYTFLCASSLYRDRDAVYNAFLYHHVCRAAAAPAGGKIQLRLCARSLFLYYSRRGENSNGHQPSTPTYSPITVKRWRVVGGNYY